MATSLRDASNVVTRRAREAAFDLTCRTPPPEAALLLIYKVGLRSNINS